MSDVDRRQDLILYLLKQAARNLETMDPDRWAGWLIFWCEVIDELAAARPRDRDAILREVRAAIDSRLEIGRW